MLTKLILKYGQMRYLQIGLFVNDDLYLPEFGEGTDKDSIAKLDVYFINNITKQKAT